MKTLILLVLSAALCLGQNTTGQKPTMMFLQINATVTASTTTYFTFGNSATSATESFRQIPMAYGCSARRLTVGIAGTQSATGSLVVILRKAGASTPLVVTIAAGSLAGSYTDSTDNAPLATGDLIGIQVVNNATAATPAISGITMACYN
jgi:hypothetical protein